MLPRHEGGGQLALVAEMALLTTRKEPFHARGPHGRLDCGGAKAQELLDHWEVVVSQ
jgi:hypothetical protein